MEKAWYLYMECQRENIILSIEGYNAMISIVPMFNQENDKPTIMIMDIYRNMAKNGIVPNIHTFNAALSAAAVLKNNRIALDLACTIFADIAKFNLQPSLTTYCHTMRILYKFGN